MAVPSHSPTQADKVALRRLGRERRQSFIQGLDREERGRLETQLAHVLAPLIAKSRVLGGYCPLPSEISPLPAMDDAAAKGAIIAFPAFADHQSTFRFLSGDPSEAGTP